jgi:hypothetical protein
MTSETQINYFGKIYEIYQSPKYNETKPKPPFHDDKKMMEIILYQLENHIEVFIETGSYMGKTIYFVGKNFPNIKCYSCEVNKNFYAIAHEQISDLPNVNLALKPSPHALYDIAKYENELFNKTCLFWLDAHWGSTPLYDEISYITEKFNKYCIIIDDFTVPNDKGFHTDGFNFDLIKPYIKNMDNVHIYMPSYASSDDCCSNNPVGYIILTNIDMELQDINIMNYLHCIHKPPKKVPVFFCCSWDTDTTKFLTEKYNPLTPHSNGIWKGIKSVNNINDAEWTVIIDDIHPEQRDMILKFNKDRIICIPREPARSNPGYLQHSFKYKLTYDNFFHSWSSIMCIKKTYDELLTFNKYPEITIKSKLCSTVTSGLVFNTGIYKERVEFIKKLSKETNKFSDKIDIFGYNWTQDELGNMYKGTLDGFNTGTANKLDNLITGSTKWDGIVNYKYSIAIENSVKDNYFSEKFTDCILAWTIPIYYGCPNINKYFPKECYYTIDINSPTVFDDIETILNTPITEMQINALKKARNVILNEHNVWDQVNTIISNDS